MAHIILFEHTNFHGAHKHVLSAEPALNAKEDNFFNDKVSSFAVLEGNWALYRDPGFQSQYQPILGPGLYPHLDAVQIKNDDMSSLQPVAARPTVSGPTVDKHILLFENSIFDGAHKHVFATEPNLNAQDDSFFNDKVSSLAVPQGNWVFYANSGLQPPSQYPPVLGSGLYPRLPAQIKNDDISSLQPTNIIATISGDRLENQVLLFEHAGFRGAHRHVFVAEPNLNASDDNCFNDKVSSISVFSGEWSFFRDSNFINPYGTVLPKGTYPFVADVGFKNDDIFSLVPDPGE
jgi:hypothetical protein